MNRYGRRFETNRISETWKQFHKIQSQSSVVIRREKRAYDKNGLKEFEKDQRNDTRKFYRTFRENILYVISYIFATKERMGLWEKILSNLDSKPPTIKQTEDTIHYLKNNRSPAEDGIIVELWKLEDEKITMKIQKVIMLLEDRENTTGIEECINSTPVPKK